MPNENQPPPTTNLILATIVFLQPGTQSKEHVVRFVAPPQVRDRLQIDQYSAKAISSDGIGHTEWVVDEVKYDLRLTGTDDDELPIATLRVTVRPKS